MPGTPRRRGVPTGSIILQHPRCVTLRWTSIPSRGGVDNNQIVLMSRCHVLETEVISLSIKQKLIDNLPGFVHNHLHFARMKPAFL